MAQAPDHPPSPSDLAGETLRMDAIPEGCVDDDPLIGAIIADRYRIEERLARGGMGAVYRAEQMAMRRPVALKLLRSELMGEATAQARFQREALAASRIESAHVVTLFDFGKTDDGLFFMAMELLSGETLATRIDREKTLAEPQAVLIGIAIAKALAAAHDAGVIHRDLKPDNVMLCGREGMVKVLDFGIAKMMDAMAVDEDGEPLTAAGVVMGTAEYMSPEAIAKRPLKPAADLYALGVILYEMLCGRPPFKHPNAMVVLGRHLRRMPPPPRSLRPGIDPALEALVLRLLAKAPEERPADGREVARDLEAIAKTLGVPTVRAKPPRSHSTLRTLIVSAVGGLAAVAIALLILLLSPGLRARLGWGASPVVQLRPEASRPTASSVTGPASPVASAPPRPHVPAPPPAAPHPLPPPPAPPVVPVTPTHAAPARPDLPPLIDPIPTHVTVTLRVTPVDTELAWDGQPVTGPTLRVPRDTQQHVLRAEAPGYITREILVVPHENLDLAIDLPTDPRARPRRVGAPATPTAPRRVPSSGGAAPGLVRVYE
ncbi:MAG: serine/threonine protein kinase [Deltaproteobacteria bacterium]|nr:serine/threonine protein kinase [Deltaproteobacteria bacterium]